MTFEIPGDDDVTKDRVDSTLAATAAAQKANPQVFVGQFGDASADKAISKAFEDDFKKAEFLSLPITLLILVAAFGSLVAAGVPLLLGLTAVMATIGLLAPISQLYPMDESVNSVVLLVGLAVGVDYSMFYLRRKMEERDAGRSSEDALAFAAATSGQAVLISGLTVMIAMAGMFFAGSIVFQSFAVGTILVVGVAVVGSLTVLPAVLSKLGDKVEKGRVPILGRMRHRNHGESRIWGWILDRVLRRPVVSLVVAGGILVVLALPALNMHTANPGTSGLPRDLAVMKVYDRIQAAFPGGPIPAIVAVQADDVTKPEVQAGHQGDERPRAGDGPDVRAGHHATSARTRRSRSSRSRCTATAPTTRRTLALAKLREDVVPRTIERGQRRRGQRDRHDRRLEGLQRLDEVPPADRLRVRARAGVPAPAGHVPLDRDPDQGDRAEPAVGRRRLRRSSPASSRRGTARACSASSRSAGSPSWLPLFLFVILFGLSMDYHVFILSRIREAVDAA